MTQRSTSATWLQQWRHDPLDAGVRLAAVPIWLAVSIPLAILAFLALALFFASVSQDMQDFFFHLPQYLFGFAWVARVEGGGFSYLFPEGTAPYACAAFWVAVTIVHAAITRRWPLTLAFIAALASVGISALLVNLAFAFLGYPPFLDGP